MPSINCFQMFASPFSSFVSNLRKPLFITAQHTTGFKSGMRHPCCSVDVVDSCKIIKWDKPRDLGCLRCLGPKRASVKKNVKMDIFARSCVSVALVIPIVLAGVGCVCRH